MPSNNPGPSRWWATAARAAGLLAAAVGGAALLGWVIGSETLTAWAAGRIPMAPSTAALFLLFGTLTALFGPPRSRGPLPAPVPIAAAIGTGLAGILFVLSVLGAYPSIEHLGLDVSGTVGGAPIGHMSPLTAIGFVLAGMAFLLAIRRAGAAHPRAAFVAAAALELMAVLLLFAYGLSQPLLYDTGIVPPALNTSLGHLLLGAGLLVAAGSRVWPEGAPPIGARPALALGIGLLVAGAGVVIPAYYLFRQYQTEYRAEVEEELTAVAGLKVAQIEEWRAELLRHAAAFHRNEIFSDLVDRALYRGDQAAASQLRRWLSPIMSTFEYQRIAVLDSAGEARVTVPDSGPAAVDAQHSAERAVRAMRTGEATLEGFHRDSTEGPVHLTLMAPVPGMGAGSPAIAAVAIRVDPHVYLYPVLMRWPTRSRTAETLLVRRDGSDVLFLNDLRFRPNAALELRLPLSRSDLPAAMAIRGAEGIVEGVDYRGVPVVAAVRAVPGSDWRLVARIDVDEVYGPLRTRLRWTIALVGVLLLGITAALAFGWQRREKVHYRSAIRAERRYGTLLRSIGDAVIATDAAGRVELMNPVAERLTGWTEAEARGRPLGDVLEIVHEETREPVESPFARIAGHGDAGVADLPDSTLLIARDGTERPIADSGAPIRDEGGSLAGVVVVFRDQTEERRARRTLAAREEKYRRLFNSIRDAILVTDKDRKIIDCNAAFTELFGYELEEIIGKDTSVVYESPDEYRRMGDELRAGTSDLVLTVGFRKKSGEVFRGETNAFPLRDDRGETVGFFGLIRDVTDRIATARALERSERRYRTLFEAAPVGVYRTDSRGGALTANQAMAAMLGFDSPEAAVAHYSDLGNQLYARPERRAELLAALEEHGSVEQFEFEGRKADGEMGWFETNARVAERREDGSFVIEGFVVDITERKRAEEERQELQHQLIQAQKMESVGRLAGGVAHDFNNMLAVILGHTELLLEDVDPDSGLTDDLKTVRDAAERSADLTRQLLTFAREQIVQPKVLDLNQTVGSMLKMLRRLIGEDIELAWRPAEAVCPIEMDPVQIDQTLANLLVNSRDAIAGVGTVTIRTDTVTVDETYAETHPEARSGDFVMLEVSDTGRGMDRDTMDRVFDPFFTTKPRGEGTGLGLATVYGIVRQNDGFINVYSEVGQGTTFRIYLPRHEGTAAEAGEAPGTRAAHRGDETILVVEDQSAVLELTRKALERLGYTVLPAASPSEALALVRDRSEPIDLVLTDVVMPEMNGHELIARLEAERPGLRTLYMSGYPADAIADRGVLQQGVHFIQKPFTVADLGASVRAALEA